MEKSCRKYYCRLDEAIQAAHEETLYQKRNINVLMKSLME